MGAIKGLTGELRHGYAVAATLGPWTVVDRRLTARLVRAHGYFSARRPLEVRLALGRRTYVWREADVQIAGGRVTGTLPGPPEVR